MSQANGWDRQAYGGYSDGQREATTDFRRSPNERYFQNTSDRPPAQTADSSSLADYLSSHSIEETYDRLTLPSSSSNNGGLGLLATPGDRASYQTIGAASSIISLYGERSPNLDLSLAPSPRPQDSSPLSGAGWASQDNTRESPKLNGSPRLNRAPSGPRPLSSISALSNYSRDEQSENASNNGLPYRRPSNSSSNANHGNFGPRSPSFGQQSQASIAEEPSPKFQNGLGRTFSSQSPSAPAQISTANYGQTQYNQSHNYQQPLRRPTNIPPLPYSYSQPLYTQNSQKTYNESPFDDDYVNSPADINSVVEVNRGPYSPAIVASPPPEPRSQSGSPTISRFDSTTSQRTLSSPRLNSSTNTRFNTPYAPEKGSTLSPNTSLTGSQYLRHNASYATLPYGTPTGQNGDEDFYGDILRHFDQALLSNLATFLKDHISRAEHTRGAIPYPNSFTGADIVNTVERALSDSHKSRSVALHAARSLHSQLFFFEVRDNTKLVHDGLDQVFVFTDADDPFDDRSVTPTRSYEDLPTGVVTELTNCYSPLCARLTAQGIGGGGCVSPSCPNNVQSVLLKRQASQASEAPSQQVQEDNLPWAMLVEKELLDILDKKEIERQNRIHELIKGEIAYVRDIEVLRTEFLEPIAESDPAIVPPDMQPDFFENVLCNAFEVKQVAQNFSDALLDRQREEAPVIQRIGDVIYASALDWSGPYVQYARQHKLAEARLKRDRAKNPLLDQFLNAFHRRPAARKLDISNFFMFIVQRLQRYKLLAQAILADTAEDNSDRESLQQAIGLIDAICRDSDNAVADTQAILDCRHLHASIIAPQGNLNDLELRDEGRKIMLRSRMYRRPESSGLTDWTALHVILFDNYLVVTKQRGKGSDVRYQLSKRPIPLQLLTATGFDEPPQPKSSRLILRSLKGADNTTPAAGSQNPSDDRMLYPITFNNMGRQGGLFILFAESQAARIKWRDALAQATLNRDNVLSTQQVFTLNTLSTDTFRARSRISDYSNKSDGQSQVPFGRPTCSASFTTPENHRLVAVGHEEGLWIGLRKDPSSYRLVLHLKAITQCAVLQDHGLLLVLANKVLIAYPLDALVPSATSGNRDTKEPQKLSGSKDVLFFKVGKVGQRLLVIYVKKDGVTQTVFKALEPIAKEDRGARTTVFMRKKTDWFREYKEFFIPSDVFGLLFMRSQLSIVCAKGFELMAVDKEPLRAISFPDWSQLRSDSRAVELQKRCNESKAVGMYRLSDAEFLFAFEDLAFYADKHGDPIKERYNDIIDWQGTARSVAHIAPYIVAFDTNFIEVRNASTGRLVQIIKGREILCTNDGLDPPSEYNARPFETDRQVQVAMRGFGGSSKDCYQVVSLLLGRFCVRLSPKTELMLCRTPTLESGRMLS